MQAYPFLVAEETGNIFKKYQTVKKVKREGEREDILMIKKGRGL